MYVITIHQYYKYSLKVPIQLILYRLQKWEVFARNEILKH